jgi:hypothetical protein
MAAGREEERPILLFSFRQVESTMPRQKWNKAHTADEL